MRSVSNSRPHRCSFAACFALVATLISPHAVLAQEVDEQPPTVEELQAQVEGLRRLAISYQKRVSGLTNENATLRRQLSEEAPEKDPEKPLEYYQDLAKLNGKLFMELGGAVVWEPRYGREITPYAVAQKAAKWMNSQRRVPYDQLALAAAEHSVGQLLGRIDEWKEAEAFYRRALERHESRLGADHRDTLQARKMVAQALDHQGRWEEAIELRVVYIDHCRQFPDQHQEDDADPSIDHLIKAYMQLGEHEAALEWARQLHKKELDGQFGMWSHGDISAMDLTLLRVLGHYEEAEQVAEALLEANIEIHGEESVHAFEALSHLVWNLYLQDKTEEADELNDRLYDLAKFMGRIQSPYSSDVYGAYLSYRGEYERAEAYLIRALNVSEGYGFSDVFLNPIFRELVDVYEAWGKPGLAEPYRQRIVWPTVDPNWQRQRQASSTSSE